MVVGPPCVRDRFSGRETVDSNSGLLLTIRAIWESIVIFSIHRPRPQPTAEFYKGPHPARIPGAGECKGYGSGKLKRWCKGITQVGPPLSWPLCAQKTNQISISPLYIFNEGIEVINVIFNFYLGDVIFLMSRIQIGSPEGNPVWENLRSN